MIDDHVYDTVCAEIFRRFPYVKGSSPKVNAYGKDQSQLIFRGKATTEDGKSINETVRVVVSANGKISKVTTSRG